jgi:hypothetical protein
MSRADLHRRARRALLGAAVFSPQSVTILTVGLVSFALNIGLFGLPAVTWLAFGGVAELIYIGATLTDRRAASHAISQMFERTFSPAHIDNVHVRQRVEQALAYYRNMQALLKQASGVRRVQIEATLGEVDTWIEQIFRVAGRIDSYENNELINRDRLRVPNEINVIRQRLANETDQGIRQELYDSIQLKETQLENLQALTNNIKRANIQLDNTLSALGTIYTQMQLLDTQALQGGRTQRLKQEINEQVLSLRDTIEAIDDMQQMQAYSFSDTAS